MPVNQTSQGDEVSAWQRQQREVRREFLQHQASTLDQKHKKAFHLFPRPLTVAWAVYA